MLSYSWLFIFHLFWHSKKPGPSFVEDVCHLPLPKHNVQWSQQSVSSLLQLMDHDRKGFSGSWDAVNDTIHDPFSLKHLAFWVLKLYLSMYKLIKTEEISSSLIFTLVVRVGVISCIQQRACNCVVLRVARNQFILLRKGVSQVWQPSYLSLSRSLFLPTCK